MPPTDDPFKEIDEMYNTAFVQQAQEQGFKQGIAQGIEKGMEQGQRSMLCATILDAIRFRLGASDEELAQLERGLLTLPDDFDLRALFHVALRTETIADFWTKLFIGNGNKDTKKDTTQSEQ